MNSAKNPIEELIKQMSLKKPSASLDQRIERLATNRPVRSRRSANLSAARTSWRASALISVASLAVGVVLGWSLSSTHQSNDSRLDSQVTMKDAIPQLDSSETQRLSLSNTISRSIDATPSDAKTRILADQLVNTPNGDVKRVYRTATPRDFWYFDKDAREIRSITVSVPRLIVTNPSGI